MRFTQLKDTCSMYELGSGYEVPETITKKEFLKQFYQETGKSPNVSISIINNCVCSDTKKNLKRLGFKKATTYRGWNGNIVNVMILKINQGNFFDRLLGI